MNFVHNQKSFQDMMTIQQATGRAITKVETGDYDMMDEVGLVTIFRAIATCLTFGCIRNLTTATEGNPEEEISRREAGAGRTPRKYACATLNTSATHDSATLAPHNTPPTCDPDVR